MKTPEVEEAIEEIAARYGSAALSVAEDRQGGAFIIVENVQLGVPYKQAETWVGFHVTHMCPYADVYPHFVRGDLARVDAAPLGEGLTMGHAFPPPGAPDVTDGDRRPAIQISRRANKRNNESRLETPLLKLLKVLQWLKSR